jgi:hypothetical protein
VGERRLPLQEAQLVFAALGTLAGVERAAGGEALCTVLERRGEAEAAHHLEQWLATRPR